MQQQVQQVTSLQSLNLIQNILLSSIGCVSYVRGLFPDDSFETKGLDGIAVKCLRKDVSTEGNALLGWLENGCFDALKKQYLQTLVFGIYLNAEDPSDLVESYEFNFNYPSKDSYAFEFSSTSTDAPSRAEVAKTTHQLVRRLLVLTQSLEPLPEHAFITMRLYYTEDTPIEYEPPQFQPCTSDIPELAGQDIKIGRVQTKHHEMTCKVTTRACELPMNGAEESTLDLIKVLRPCSLEPTQTKDSSEEDVEEEEELISQEFAEQLTTTAVEKPAVSSSKSSKVAKPQLPKKAVLIVKESIYEEPAAPEQEEQQDAADNIVHGTQLPLAPKASTKAPSKSTKTIKWGCICNHSVLSEFPDLQECISCKSTGHSVCYGLSGTDTFKCHRCTPMVSEKDLYNLSVYRRATNYISTHEFPRAKTLLARTLLGIKRDSTESLAMIEPLFDYLLSKNVVESFKKREACGKNRKCFKVTEHLDSVWAEELGYSQNLKQTGRARSLEAVEEEEEEEEQAQPPVLAVKRRKVSVVKHDVPVL